MDLGIGVTSVNCVDAAVGIADEFDLPLMLIASRRQVDACDLGGGYVNRWCTEEFARYVRARDHRRNVTLARDHGGPWQRDSDLESASADEAMAAARFSFEIDIASGFELIHLDPVRHLGQNGTDRIERYIERTIALHEFCHAAAHRAGRAIGIEIGTEECPIGDAPPRDVARILDGVVAHCDRERLPRPRFMVVPCGTKVMETRNVGPLSTLPSPEGDEPPDDDLRDLIARCHAAGVAVKAHNADYLPDARLGWFIEHEIDAVNVAPEFGVVETRALLATLRRAGCDALAERFLELAFASRKWEKWMLPDSDADDVARAIIAGHYVYSTPEFAEIIAAARPACRGRGIDLDRELVSAVRGAILGYLVALGCCERLAR
ncbi:MAG: hypothetical protein WD066_12215 [Planctomycetaceae bacterium]